MTADATASAMAQTLASSQWYSIASRTVRARAGCGARIVKQGRVSDAWDASGGRVSETKKGGGAR
ncbi:hypothetical protein C7455_106206 [Roseicyclus mahoneyensis]|uniref:Uncharacterized protein n=1 Tax=Roseicyclus mahoneyensis TaxID=164332 RepID=A0A316GHA1_9RHOB|nr:hypothetical protein C7455_106206 [Roseicyclus mahoneyensis]